jgi:acyl-coenzyme A thioesterase PaaI-like protein
VPSVPENVDLRFPFDDGGCFGCSARNPAGLQLRFRRHGDRIVGTYSIDDRFHGAPGIAHGGIVATILDEFSCATAVFLLGIRVVTGELSVRYECPCPVERPLEISAHVIDTSHPRYVEIGAEIRSDGQRLVRSRGKFFAQATDRPIP